MRSFLLLHAPPVVGLLGASAVATDQYAHTPAARARLVQRGAILLALPRAYIGRHADQHFQLRLLCVGCIGPRAQIRTQGCDLLWIRVVVQVVALHTAHRACGGYAAGWVMQCGS